MVVFKSQRFSLYLNRAARPCLILRNLSVPNFPFVH